MQNESDYKELDYGAVWATIRDVLRLYVHSFEDDEDVVAINLVDAFDWCIDDKALSEADRGDRSATLAVRASVSAWMDALGFTPIAREVALAELGEHAAPDPNLLWFRRAREADDVPPAE
jgi:hypothetical protein